MKHKNLSQPQTNTEEEEEIEARINFHIAFNRELGIAVDHPNMRTVCRSLLERNANPVVDLEIPLLEDDDGMKNLDSDLEQFSAKHNFSKDVGSNSHPLSLVGDEFSSRDEDVD